MSLPRLQIPNRYPFVTAFHRLEAFTNVSGNLVIQIVNNKVGHSYDLEPSDVLRLVDYLESWLRENSTLHQGFYPDYCHLCDQLTPCASCDKCSQSTCDECAATEYVEKGFMKPKLKHFICDSCLEIGDF